MRTDDFDFELPRDLIAQQPIDPRDAAKLLVVDGPVPEDHLVRDLPELLQPGDILVTNNTKVIPARLAGRRLNDAGTRFFRGSGEAWQLEALRRGERVRPLHCEATMENRRPFDAM